LVKNISVTEVFYEIITEVFCDFMALSTIGFIQMHVQRTI